MKLNLKIFGYTVVVIIAIVILCKSCTTIDSASYGIKFRKWSADETQQGGVIGTVRGFVWYNPFTVSVFQYEGYTMRKQYEGITVNAKDGAIFDITPSIAYRINPDKVTEIFVKYRKPLKEIENGFMHTCIYEAYRTVGNKYTSDYLMSNRGEFESEVRTRLEESLMSQGFIVQEFTAAIDPPESLKNAINQKNMAIQEALKAENEIAKAKANAEIEVAKAEGEAKALKIKADAEAYYNRTVAASLSALLIQQDAVEKWDGKLPVYSAGGAGGNLINLPTVK
jgi:regulator of protease activity HflC (stomatin/prohibitin superfamily)